MAMSFGVQRLQKVAFLGEEDGGVQVINKLLLMSLSLSPK
jgi:hypothetical protein